MAIMGAILAILAFRLALSCHVKSSAIILEKNG